MVIAMTNSKGGVGKFTLAVHLTAWWGEQGARVALVDADVQGSSSVWLHEAAPDLPVFRLQTPDDVLEQVSGIAGQFDQVIVDGPAGLSEVNRQHKPRRSSWRLNLLTMPALQAHWPTPHPVRGNEKRSRSRVKEG
jgi:hypothetical protein